MKSGMLATAMILLSLLLPQQQFNVSSLPITQNFDALTTAATVFPNFTNATNDSLDWEVNSGFTGSSSTGPSDDVSGGGKYIYMETSPASNNAFATLVSDSIDLSTAANPEVRFFYHMHGETIGSLQVMADSGAGPEMVFQLLNEQQADELDPFLEAVIDLNAYIGDTIVLQFIGTVGPTGFAFRSDIALDQITIQERQAIDAELLSITVPEASCYLSNAENISVEMRNNGFDTLTNIPVSYQINGGATVNEVIPGPVAPNQIITYNFNTPADLSAPQVYQITAFTAMPGELAPTNDTLTASAEQITPLTSFPIEQNFDTLAESLEVFPFFSNDPTASLEFETEAGGTGSLNTGPSEDASGNGIYVYIEASGAGTNARGRLISECIDLGGAINPKVTFKYHMYGSNVEALRVFVQNPAINDTLLILLGEQQFDETDPWKDTTLDLSTYIGQTIQVVFEAQASSFRGDIALDEISIFQQRPFDAGITHVFPPKAACSLTANESVSVVIRNLGLNTLTSIPVGVSVDNGPVMRDTVITNLPQLTSDTFALPNIGLDLSVPGTYEVLAFTELPLDSAAGNDSATAAATHIVPLDTAIFPIYEGFDTFETNVTVFPFFTNDDNADIAWETGRFQTPTSSTGPAEDALDFGNYLFMESSDGGANSEAILNSACLDFSGTTQPKLYFAYHMFGSSIHSLKVEVTGDTNMTFVELLGQQQFSLSNPWKDTLVDLTPLIGKVVQIRFIGKLNPTSPFNRGDIALDEITIWDPLQNDVAIVSFLGPKTLFSSEDEITLPVVVKNLGMSRLDSAQVNFAMTLQDSAGGANKIIPFPVGLGFTEDMFTGQGQIKEAVFIPTLFPGLQNGTIEAFFELIASIDFSKFDGGGTDQDTENDVITPDIALRESKINVGTEKENVCDSTCVFIKVNLELFPNTAIRQISFFDSATSQFFSFSPSDSSIKVDINGSDRTILFFIDLEELSTGQKGTIKAKKQLCIVDCKRIPQILESSFGVVDEDITEDEADNDSTKGNIFANDVPGKGQTLEADGSSITGIGGGPFNAGFLNVDPNGDFEFAPNQNFNGNAAAIVEVKDPNDSTAELQKLLDFYAVNPDSPRAVPDNFTFLKSQSRPVQVNLFKNDIIPEDFVVAGDTPFQNLQGPFADGFFVDFDPQTGIATFDWENGFTGDISFEYTLKDVLSGQTYSKTKVKVNVRPKSTDDEVENPTIDPANYLDSPIDDVQRDPITGNIIEDMNARIPNGDQIGIQTFPELPSPFGTMTIQGNGDFIFQPNPGFFGVAQVNVRVFNVNDPNNKFFVNTLFFFILRRPRCPKDNYEPNDDIFDAANTFTGVLAGVKDRTILCPRGDEDYFEVTIPTGGKTLKTTFTGPANKDYEVDVRNNQDVVIAASNTTGHTLNNLPPGKYYVRVFSPTNQASGKKYSLTISLLSPPPPASNTTKPNLTSPVFKPGEALDELIRIYPNPADELVNIAFETPILTLPAIRLTSVDGRQISTLQLKQLSDTRISLSTRDLAPGMYLIHIPYENGLKTEKLIIAR